MSAHFPALVVIPGLLTAFVIIMAGWFRPRICFSLALMAMIASLLSAAGLLLRVMREGVVSYHLGGWDPPWGIAYRVDFLNGLVLVVVTAVALAGLVATRERVAVEFSDRLAPFYALLTLFVTGLSGIVVTGDAFNLYVLLEIAALTGYGLIGMGGDRGALAGLNYILMGTIGASFYLLGIGYLYLATGTLNMVDIAGRLPDLYGMPMVSMAFFLCLTGLFVKMALFPLHAWLPNAYTHAPSVATVLIAPLTTKVMVYVMIRITLTVFTPEYAFTVLSVSDGIVWLAAAGIVTASLLALSQTGMRRMLTYVVIAEVGYMVGGFWLGNRAGMTGAILHIVNDSAMTLCVFLAVAAIGTRVDGDGFEGLGGLFGKMPFTMAAFVAGGLSIIGVPPTCGFFSKWYLISGGVAAGQWVFVFALLFSSLVNLVLFFRIIECAYYGGESGPHGQDGRSGHGEEGYDGGGGFHGGVAVAEAPVSMVAPLLMVALGLLALGLCTGGLVSGIIQFAIPAGVV